MNIIWIPVDPAILNGPTLSHFGREKNAIITSAKDYHNYVADDFPIVQTPKGLLGSRWSLNMDPLPHTSDTSTASSRDGWTLRIYTPMRYAPELGGSATHSNREGHINYKYDNWEISFDFLIKQKHQSLRWGELLGLHRYGYFDWYTAIYLQSDGTFFDNTILHAGAGSDVTHDTSYASHWEENKWYNFKLRKLGVGGWGGTGHRHYAEILLDDKPVKWGYSSGNTNKGFIETIEWVTIGSYGHSNKIRGLIDNIKIDTLPNTFKVGNYSLG
jgi:hypothetical protein